VTACYPWPVDRWLPPRVQAVVAELHRRLSRRFGADLVDLRVFGSVARGQAHEESDVDVFVLLRRAGWAERRAVLDIAADLWVESELFLSPTVMDEGQHREWRRQERPLVMDIERQGIPV